MWYLLFIIIYHFRDDVVDELPELTGRASIGELSLSDRKEIRRQPSIAFDRKSSTVNEAYLQFVNTLLKECKTKVSQLECSSYLLE